MNGDLKPAGVWSWRRFDKLKASRICEKALKFQNKDLNGFNELLFFVERHEKNSYFNLINIKIKYCFVSIFKILVCALTLISGVKAMEPDLNEGNIEQRFSGTKHKVNDPTFSKILIVWEYDGMEYEVRTPVERDATAAEIILLDMRIEEILKAPPCSRIGRKRLNQALDGARL
jgi:hypothetical protein